MILRKPYAFFIKHFKLIHIILAFLMYYALYLNKKVLDFFNEYSSTLINVVGQNLIDKLVPTILQIIPILIIGLLIIVLVVMIVKKKPIIFYVVNIGIYAYLFVMIQVSYSTLATMSETLIQPRTVLLVRDLVMFAFLLQIASCVVVTIRATGFDVRKFDFKEDLRHLDISEEDREEIEVDVKFDKNLFVRNLRKIKRYAKYGYKENQLIANIGISLVCILLLISIVVIINQRPKILSQQDYFVENGFEIGVMNSYLVNTDYKGNKLTNDYYLILKINIKNQYEPSLFDIATTEILIGNYVYAPTDENSSNLFDFGNIYKGEKIGLEYEEKILVYKIPRQLINKKMYFSFINKNYLNDKNYNRVKVNIEYENLTGISSNEIQNVTKEMKLSDSILPDYKINISAFDIQKQYKLSYNYCIKKECIKSYEYLKPTLNTNYDKALLKIMGTLEYERKITGVNNLYDFINKFGMLSYTVDGKTKVQKIGLDQIKSKRLEQKDTYYIEVIDEVMKAEKISLLFTIRNKNYEYVLK